MITISFFWQTPVYCSFDTYWLFSFPQNSTFPVRPCPESRGEESKFNALTSLLPCSFLTFVFLLSKSLLSNVSVPIVDSKHPCQSVYWSSIWLDPVLAIYFHTQTHTHTHFTCTCSSSYLNTMDLLTCKIFGWAIPTCLTWSLKRACFDITPCDKVKYINCFSRTTVFCLILLD